MFFLPVGKPCELGLFVKVYDACMRHVVFFYYFFRPVKIALNL